MNGLVPAIFRMCVVVFSFCFFVVAAPAAESPGKIDAKLSFSLGEPQPTFIFHRAGKRYRLVLDPDFDRVGRVVTLTLVLHQKDDPEDAPNLLSGVRGEHGYQKYIFSASDFAGGTTDALYGANREIQVRSLPATISVHVLSSAIDKTTVGNDVGYSFSKLALGVSVEHFDMRGR